jgi:hypothetical protein
MPKRRDPQIEKYLKEAWIAASQAPIEFDYTKEVHGDLRRDSLATMLYNYRKTVRQKRLAPQFDEIWSLIKDIELVKCRSAKLILRKKVYIRIKVISDIPPLPFCLPNTFNELENL